MRADSSSLIIYFQCIHDDYDCDMVRLGGLRGTIYFTSKLTSCLLNHHVASQSQNVVGLEGKKMLEKNGTNVLHQEGFVQKCSLFDLFAFE
jgi:hypothetical protein